MSGTRNHIKFVIEQKICKNIMIQAYNNPSTSEELSIELGIALPY